MRDIQLIQHQAGRFEFLVVAGDAVLVEHRLFLCSGNGREESKGCSKCYGSIHSRPSVFE